MLMIAAILATVAPASAGALQPTGKWQLEKGEYSCTAARRFGNADGGVDVLIERLPFGRSTSVSLFADSKTIPSSVRGEVSLATEAGELTASSSAGVRELADRRRKLTLSFPGNFIRRSASATTYIVSGSKLRVPALQLDGMSSLSRVFEECERNAAQRLGINPDAQALVDVPASAIGTTDVFRLEDYPAKAVKNELEGNTHVLWRIDAHGRAHDCRVLKSSGHEVLDRAACSVIMERARFIPAKDKAGKSVESYMSRPLFWRLPI